jgi:hypothetical protein
LNSRRNYLVIDKSIYFKTVLSIITTGILSIAFPKPAVIVNFVALDAAVLNI